MLSLRSIHIISPTFFRAVSYMRLAPIQKEQDLLSALSLSSVGGCDLQFGCVPETTFITYVWLYTPHKHHSVYRIDRSQKQWRLLIKYMKKRMALVMNEPYVQWEV